MATKARAGRTSTKKTQKKPSKQAAESPFFRPFAKLASKGRKSKAEKGEKTDKAAKPEKSASATKQEGGAKKQAPQRVPVQLTNEQPEPEVLPSDAETFAMYMAGVRTLEDRKARVPRSSTPIEPKSKAQRVTKDLDADARHMLHSLVAEGVRFEVTDDGERIEGRRLDVDPRELRRLRRGAYTVDGRLDLHGMNAGEARREVEKFVRKRRADGDRVVALIHGRGNHSPRGIGVLRGEIAAWLSQGPVAHHVAAFASAPEEEGGTGVVLALLAR
ncbi:Smr/MutS family protein [Polyangium sp. y55x31]|uniref:Smr/MutS family protein n=1 Tax=Polyangium sp. y55x31 TaxID=3042688 RepID=UPI002482BD49|nr:Smr/MutS family protein [Polyangium sp. y55x31]MDI1479445.1 Smr/MutS family protein [Polyangium sp. y55x31]